MSTRYYAKDGAVLERTHGGALCKIVVECMPHGKRDRRFGCPDAAAMAITVADALNAGAQS